MPQKPNNIPIIIAAVAALGGIALLNVMQQKNDPALLEKMQKEAEQEAAKKQQENAKNAPPAPSGPIDPNANEVAAWGPEKMMGKTGGSPQVTVGWIWTPAAQGNPGLIYTVVDAVTKAMPNAAIRVVNLDAKPGAVPAGVAVGGKVTMAAQPDGSLPPAGAIGAALKRPG